MRDQLWQREFWRIISEHQRFAFAWGVHDCVTIARRVAALTRTDLVLPDWSTEREALRLIAARSLHDRAVDALGPSVPWGQCQIGDIGYAENISESPALPGLLCVHDGTRFIGPNAVGLKAIPWDAIRCGWLI